MGLGEQEATKSARPRASAHAIALKDVTVAFSLAGGARYVAVEVATLQVAAPPSSFQDKDGVYAIEWTYDIVHDSTWGKATTAALINKTTAL